MATYDPEDTNTRTNESAWVSIKQKATKGLKRIAEKATPSNPQRTATEGEK